MLEDTIFIKAKKEVLKINNNKKRVQVFFKAGTEATRNVNNFLYFFMQNIRQYDIEFYQEDDCISEVLSNFSLLGLSVGDKICLTNQNDVAFKIRLIPEPVKVKRPKKQKPQADPVSPVAIY